MKTINEKEDELIIELGRLAVEGFYDYQEIREGQLNRIRDIVRRKVEKIPMEKPEKKKEKEERTYVKKYTDKQLMESLKKLIADKKLTLNERNYLEKLLSLGKETKQIEQRYKTLMNDYLLVEPLWYMWLGKIRGISSILGSNLMKNFGYCETYEYVSSLWRHCGLDPDGAKGRKKGEKIHYNPKLKTLAWKISDSFIKQRTPVYRDIYDSEKARQLSLKEHEAENAPKSLLHADLRARRKMVKIFLQHYWLVGRHIKKLPLSKPYPQDKMGHKHYIPPPFYKM
jgi:hypothetical protein